MNDVCVVVDNSWYEGFFTVGVKKRKKERKHPIYFNYQIIAKKNPNSHSIGKSLLSIVSIQCLKNKLWGRIYPEIVTHFNVFIWKSNFGKLFVFFGKLCIQMPDGKSFDEVV